MHLLRILLPALAALVSITAARAETARGFSVARPPDSAVVLPVPADYLAAEIEIRAEEDDWLARLDTIESARGALAQAAVAAGFVLHVERPVTMRPEYGKSFSSFSSGGGDPFHQPGADLRLLARLAPGADTLVVVRKMRSVIDGLKLSKKTTIRFGEIRLALDKPETRRPQLLAAIAKHLEQTRAALAPGNGLSVSGLDAPLRLSQLDEHTIGVHLPFETSYTIGQKL